MVRQWGNLRRSLLRRRITPRAVPVSARPALASAPSEGTVASPAAPATAAIHAREDQDSSQAGEPSIQHTAATSQIHEGLPFQLRETFALPNRVTSWFVGHMYRAMRSLPTLLKRKPPPLIIEVRDARLPFSSINVAFEQTLEKMEKEKAEEREKSSKKASSSSSTTAGSSSSPPSTDWKSRRLVVYNKADLIDQRLIAPMISAFSSLEGQEVMFVNSTKDRDVRRVIGWVKKSALVLQKNGEIDKTYPQQADSLTSSISSGESPSSSKQPEKRLSRSEERIKREKEKRKSARSNLTGAFRYTTTPEDGVRLVIVGMPNVGKSSLLNALRRVGTGKGKAASTAPEPGHTRKLTGTVRITPEKKKEAAPSSSSSSMHEPTFQLDTGDRKARRGSKPGDAVDQTSSSAVSSRPPPPSIYVYDTPGIMVPFLGRGDEGSEKAMKLMVTAGMKTMWFDKMALADYLLYRMNLQWAWSWRVWNESGRRGITPRPAYIRHLPLSTLTEPTNDIQILLEDLATKAPGTLSKGGVRNLEGAADFFLTQWRDGKLGIGELDLACFEGQASLDNGMRRIANPSADDDEKATAGDAEADEGTAQQSISSSLAEYIKTQFQTYLRGIRRAARSGAGTSMRPARGADRASRRFMEKQDHSSLLEYSKKGLPSPSPSDGHGGADDADYLAHADDNLLSKNQARRKEKALGMAVRNSRLRELGVPVRSKFNRQRDPPSKRPVTYSKHSKAIRRGKGKW